MASELRICGFACLFVFDFLAFVLTSGSCVVRERECPMSWSPVCCCALKFGGETGCESLLYPLYLSFVSGLLALTLALAWALTLESLSGFVPPDSCLS
eukprot:scaffold2888_cov274-Pinguiococcus_pyrenoidosus.AAC.8